jgi:hypothetical protein
MRAMGGQNHVSPKTMQATRSARAAVTEVPIGPPQSWPTMTRPSSWRESTSSPTTVECPLAACSGPRGAIGEPEPGGIERHEAEAVAELQDQVAIEEAPSRVSVQEQQRLTPLLVDVVDAAKRRSRTIAIRTGRAPARVRSQGCLWVTCLIYIIPMPLAMLAMPLGLTTYQKPPWSLTCWHMICPGFLSPSK